MSLDDFEIGFTLSSNKCSYNRLCQFGNAMRWGLYIPISSEDIRKGVDYEKARMKMKLKVIDGLMNRNVSQQEIAIVDTYCENLYCAFMSYNDRNKNNMLKKA